MRSTQFVTRHADEVKQIARLLEIHRHATGHVVNLADGADQERGRNGDRLGGALGAEFVIETVFAADEGRTQLGCHVVTGQGRANQRTERLGPVMLPQQKLSRIAIRCGSAPTATQFRTASSIAAAAIQ